MLVNFAWNQAAVVRWRTWYTYTALIIGLASLVAFGLLEQRAINPLVPAEDFNGSVLYIMACVAQGWGSFGICFFYTYQLIVLLSFQPSWRSIKEWWRL